MADIMPALVVGTIIGVVIGWFAHRHHMAAEIAEIDAAIKNMEGIMYDIAHKNAEKAGGEG